MFNKLKLLFAKNESAAFFLFAIFLVIFISSQIDIGEDLAVDSVLTDSFSADANNILALIQILDQIALDEELITKLSKYSNYVVFPVQIEQSVRTGVVNPFFAN